MKINDKNSLNKKGFIQIPFSWLFSIVIGAIIIFFAIYASVKLMGTEEAISSAETGKEIAVLLNPLETGFGEEKTTPLSIAVNSQIINECKNLGNFGEQVIGISQKVNGEWSRTGTESTFYNKYIFSDRRVEDKNFYLFSKPFEFPFKVADLIFLTSAKETYCFEDSPDEIKDELKAVSQANLFIENCPSESKKICFSDTSGCDIVVDESEKSVDRGQGVVYYETNALMFAAIFSDKAIYECQVKRLMQRTNELALIYNYKGNNIVEKGCIAEVNLLLLAQATSSLRDSSQLIMVNSVVETVEEENMGAYCELW